MPAKKKVEGEEPKKAPEVHKHTAVKDEFYIEDGDPKVRIFFDDGCVEEHRL